MPPRYGRSNCTAHSTPRKFRGLCHTFIQSLFESVTNIQSVFCVHQSASEEVHTLFVGHNRRCRPNVCPAIGPGQVPAVTSVLHSKSLELQAIYRIILCNAGLVFSNFTAERGCSPCRIRYKPAEHMTQAEGKGYFVVLHCVCQL